MQGSTTLERKAALTTVSHSTGKGHTDGLPMALGQEKAARHTVSTEMEQGSLGSREWVHIVCAYDTKFQHFFIGSSSLETKHGAASNKIQ